MIYQESSKRSSKLQQRLEAHRLIASPSRLKSGYLPPLTAASTKLMERGYPSPQYFEDCFGSAQTGRATVDGRPQLAQGGLPTSPNYHPAPDWRHSYGPGVGLSQLPQHGDGNNYATQQGDDTDDDFWIERPGPLDLPTYAPVTDSPIQSQFDGSVVFSAGLSQDTPGGQIPPGEFDSLLEFLDNQARQDLEIVFPDPFPNAGILDTQLRGVPPSIEANDANFALHEIDLAWLQLPPPRYGYVEGNMGRGGPFGSDSSPQTGGQPNYTQFASSSRVDQLKAIPPGPTTLEFSEHISLKDGSEYQAYPHMKTALPVGVTFEEICRVYPNHLWDNILLQFKDAQWSEERIWRTCPVDGRRNSSTTRPWNYLQKRVARSLECRGLRTIGPPQPNKGRKSKRKAKEMAENGLPTTPSPSAEIQRPVKRSKRHRVASVRGRNERPASALHEDRLLFRGVPDLEEPAQTIGPQLETGISQPNAMYGQAVGILETADTETRNPATREEIESVIQKAHGEMQRHRFLLRAIARLDLVTELMSEREQEINAQTKWTTRALAWERTVADKYMVNVPDLLWGKRDHIEVLRRACLNSRLPKIAFEQQRPGSVKLEVDEFCWRLFLAELKKWSSVWQAQLNFLVAQRRLHPQLIRQVEAGPAIRLTASPPSNAAREMMQQPTCHGLPIGLTPNITQLQNRQPTHESIFPYHQDLFNHVVPNEGVHVKRRHRDPVRDSGGDGSGSADMAAGLPDRCHDAPKKGLLPGSPMLEPQPTANDAGEISELELSPDSVIYLADSLEDDDQGDLMFPGKPRPEELVDPRKASGLQDILERFPNSLTLVKIGQAFLRKPPYSGYVMHREKMVTILTLHFNSLHGADMNAPGRREGVTSWLVEQLRAAREARDGKHKTCNDRGEGLSQETEEFLNAPAQNPIIVETVTDNSGAFIDLVRG